MKIIDVEIGTVVSLYVVKCDCGLEFKSRVDRWKLTCPGCHKEAKTRELDGADDEIRDSRTDFQDPT